MLLISFVYVLTSVLADLVYVVVIRVSGWSGKDRSVNASAHAFRQRFGRFPLSMAIVSIILAAIVLLVDRRRSRRLSLPPRLFRQRAR